MVSVLTNDTEISVSGGNVALKLKIPFLDGIKRKVAAVLRNIEKEEPF